MDGNEIYSELIYIGDKQNETTNIVKKNTDVLDTIMSEVLKQPEPPVVVIPDRIVVDNLPEIQKVEVTNQETINLSTVEDLLNELVNTIPTIKDDKSYEVLSKLLKLFSEDQTKIKTLELLRAILDKKDPEFPSFPEQIPYQIPEELISKDGRIKVEVDRTGGGSVSTLVDLDGERISPATEAKQDDIVTAIQNITIPAPVGGATEAKQNSQISLETTLNTLAETLQELTTRLTALASTVANTAQLRVVQASVPTTTVTGTVTVASTVVSSLTNFGTGVPAREVADDINNFTVALANINNVSIT